MNDSIPTNIFFDDALTKQINEIVGFRDSLKEKNKAVFEDEDVFIALNFESFPKYGPEKNSLSFATFYSDNLPQSIKSEFESYFVPTSLIRDK